jgi:hypothetical protein
MEFNSSKKSCNAPLLYQILEKGPNPIVDCTALAEQERTSFSLLARPYSIPQPNAIAFCPWQRGLLTLGGGSNDHCIHFYHSPSGSRLSKINCCAQVTNLAWSTTRREISATFGFAQPEHLYHIALFSWSIWTQMMAAPWYDERRILCAISYTGRPNARDEGSKWLSRTKEDRCLVVATSDCSNKFHEEKRGFVSGRGRLLGERDILESLHKIDTEGVEIVR